VKAITARDHAAGPVFIDSERLFQVSQSQAHRSRFAREQEGRMTRSRLVSFSVTLFLTTTFFTTAAFACAPPTSDAVQASLSKDLAKYPGLTVKVDDCMATLSGTVDRYTDKLAAYHKAHSFGALAGVVNNITVAGLVVPDEELTKKLQRALAYDRSMTDHFSVLDFLVQENAFDWFTVNVNQGAVTLSGYAHNPMAHASAISVVDSEKGVKDVVDHVEVLPASITDDQIRLQAYRLIYYGSSFIGSGDPTHPIRIIVDNGHVILEGVVITPLDKQVTGMRVLGMSGVFSLQNNLQVKKG
jgi:osmotically-inducible protein OsmY